jgi:solute carrier family 44 (choline transporter-like protein), member 1
MMAYCFSYGNIRRVLNGYDDCGNICGVMNERDTKLGCKGIDKRKEKFFLVERSENPKYPDKFYIHRQCVESCSTIPNYKPFLNRCVSMKKDETTTQSLMSKTGLTNFFQDVSEDLATCWCEILYVCLIACVFSIILLFLFRYLVGFVVWIILIASVVLGVIATIFLWVKYGEYKKQDQDRESTYLISAIVSTVVTILIFLLIVVMRKRVKLVIELFKEAGKAISDMPLLLFEPLLVSGHSKIEHFVRVGKISSGILSV